MVPFFISHPIYWLLNWQLIRFIIFLNTIKSMIEPVPYFSKLVPPKECIDGIDNIIIDIIGIHYFEEDNVGTHYQIIWSKRRNVAIWEPTDNLTNIRDGLLLWKCYVLTFLYSCLLELLYLCWEQQLNDGYVRAMIIHDRCDKTNLPYPSWTDAHVNEYDHCTRKVIWKIYCMCTFLKEYGGCDHYLVSWEAPYENSHCWLDRGQLWGIITCDGMREIDNWSCSFRSWLHTL